MDQLYIVGGQQHGPRSALDHGMDWYDYKQGIILHLDVQVERVLAQVEYRSQPGACRSGDPVLFKSATAEGDRLYACTQTEIIIYALPSFEQVGYLSLPCFNDVHHVRPTLAGTLLVANTGLEMVLEVTVDGQILREWNVLGEDPWAHFSRDIDYRQGINLKPHRAHPNYVFTVGDEIWATRFEKCDAVCLTQPGLRIAIGQERVHDGVVQGNKIYFTTVDGHLVIVDAGRLQVEQILSFNELHGEERLLGWCRGLLLDGDRIWVGFSRIRPTRFREALSWIHQGFQRSLPTHIACYDLIRHSCLAEIDLEQHGLNAVFSIHAATGHEPAGDIVGNAGYRQDQLYEKEYSYETHS